MKLKIVFYDTERDICYTSPQSTVRCFREYMSIAQPPGFSDCNFTPNPCRYIPLLFSGMKDKNELELWEGHIVNFQMVEDSPTLLTGEVVFEEANAWFGVRFVEGNEVVIMPLFGLDLTKLEIIRHKHNGFDETFLSTVKYGQSIYRH